MRHFFELTFLMMRRDMIVRYRGTILGYIWSVLNPLVFAMVYFVAFKHILRIPVENYAVFLLTGLFPWLWMSNALNNGTKGFETYQAVLKSGVVNPVIIPFFVVIIEFVNFLFSLPVVFVLVAFSSVPIPFSGFIYFPLIFLLTLLFLLSTVSIVACLSLVFRDLGHLIQLLVQMLFFLSPIIYPVDLVPDSLKSIYHVNPFVDLIQLWRQLLYTGDIQLELAVYPFILSCVLCVVSYFCLKIIGNRAVQWI
jgi:lipopolysaccharide transport system permease protein